MTRQVNCHTSAHILLGIYPKEMMKNESKCYVGEETFDTICLMLKNREQSSRLMVEAHLKKLWYGHFIEYYLALRIIILKKRYLHDKICRRWVKGPRFAHTLLLQLCKNVRLRTETGNEYTELKSITVVGWWDFRCFFFIILPNFLQCFYIVFKWKGENKTQSASLI